MNLINCYGFSVDSQTMRVYLTEGKVATLSEGVPAGADGVTKGADHGDIVQKLKKVVTNADLNLLYVDIAGKPYGGTVKTWENLPHDEMGRLLVDSVGKIVGNYKGLAFTEFGGVAMLAADVPNAPTLNNVWGAKDSIVLDFTYDVGNGDNLEPKYYIGYAIGGGKTVKAEVYDPDEDMAIGGLTEGVLYDCYVTAVSATGKEGPKSNQLSVKCESVIPAPVFNSCIAGNGFATVTYTQTVAPPAPWTIDHYAYSAIDMDKPNDPAVEGHVIDGKIALPNDTRWYVRLCAVCNPGRVPGNFSDALTVIPENPIAPYKPTITQAYADQSGQILVEWVKGTAQNGNHTSGTTVDQWKVFFTPVTGGGAAFEQTCAGDVTSIKSQKVNIGIWQVSVAGHNEQGWGSTSNPVGVEYKPTVQDPLVGGVSDDDGTYKYCVFYSNETTGYEALRTPAGVDTTFEVLMVGAGGSGKGQTLTMGKGGDGGGGQLVISTLPPAPSGSVFITVPNGAKSGGDTPPNTTVKEGSTVLTAIAGKSATDKNNAEGFPKTEVPKSWWKLRQFWWFEPESHYVGGVATQGEQNYPRATFCGEGGAGTKDSHPGNGAESYVAIRWKK